MEIGKWDRSGFDELYLRWKEKNNTPPIKQKNTEKAKFYCTKIDNLLRYNAFRGIRNAEYKIPFKEFYEWCRECLPSSNISPSNLYYLNNKDYLFIKFEEDIFPLIKSYYAGCDIHSYHCLDGEGSISIQVIVSEK